MTAGPLQQNLHMRVRQAHFDMQQKYAELAPHARFPVTCIALSLIGPASKHLHFRNPMCTVRTPLCWLFTCSFAGMENVEEELQGI